MTTPCINFSAHNVAYNINGCTNTQVGHLANKLVDALGINPSSFSRVLREFSNDEGTYLNVGPAGGIKVRPYEQTAGRKVSTGQWMNALAIAPALHTEATTSEESSMSTTRDLTTYQRGETQLRIQFPAGGITEDMVAQVYRLLTSRGAHEQESVETATRYLRAGNYVLAINSEGGLYTYCSAAILAWPVLTVTQNTFSETAMPMFNLKDYAGLRRIVVDFGEYDTEEHWRAAHRMLVAAGARAHESEGEVAGYLVRRTGWRLCVDSDGDIITYTNQGTTGYTTYHYTPENIMPKLSTLTAGQEDIAINTTGLSIGQRSLICGLLASRGYGFDENLEEILQYTGDRYPYIVIDGGCDVWTDNELGNRTEYEYDLGECVDFAVQKEEQEEEKPVVYTEAAVYLPTHAVSEMRGNLRRIRELFEHPKVTDGDESLEQAMTYLPDYPLVIVTKAGAGYTVCTYCVDNEDEAKEIVAERGRPCRLFATVAELTEFLDAN